MHSIYVELFGRFAFFFLKVLRVFCALLVKVHGTSRRNPRAHPGGVQEARGRLALRANQRQGALLLRAGMHKNRGVRPERLAEGDVPAV